MKKMILTGTMILALAGASLLSARAGDREWAMVGKVLTGVAVVGLVAAVVDGHAHADVSYSCGAPANCPPPQAVSCPPPAPPCNYTCCPPPAVVYCPPPVVVYRAPVMVYPAPRIVHYRSYRSRW
jgi:hypothetical protein